MCCGRRQQRLLEQEKRKQQQQQQQEKRIPRSPVVRDTSLASSAIASALRFPSPSRSPQPERDVDNVHAEVLDRAGIEPPSYDSVMTEEKPQTKAAEASGSHQREINAFPIRAASSTHKEAIDAIPDDVTVFSEDPAMYTPPTTRAPTVIYDHDRDERDEDSDVDSVLEELREWQSRQAAGHGLRTLDSQSSAPSSTWKQQRAEERLRRKEEKRSEKDQRKAAKAAKKAEKWANRAVRSGHVFEPNWMGGQASVGVVA